MIAGQPITLNDNPVIFGAYINSFPTVTNIFGKSPYWNNETSASVYAIVSGIISTIESSSIAND